MGTNISTQLHNRFFSPHNLNESFFEVEENITLPYAHNWADITGTGIIQDAFFYQRLQYTQQHLAREELQHGRKIL